MTFPITSHYPQNSGCPCNSLGHFKNVYDNYDDEQEGLAVASIARDDLSTLPGDDPFPRAH